MRYIFVLTMGLLTACSPKPHGAGQAKYHQGVTGIVVYVPGYDHEDATLMMNPPDLTPRPLKEAIITLYDFHGIEEPAGKEIVSTQTDGTGFYQLQADTGTYFLAVSGARGQFLLTTGNRGKNFTREQQVNLFQIIKLLPDTTITQDLHLTEMSLY